MITVRTTRSDPNWIDRVLSRFKKMSSQEVAVGFPAGAQGISSPYYPDGASILNVAIWNNFGMGVPRRPFFDNAVVNIQKEAPKIIRLAVKKFPDSVEKSLGIVGEWAKTKVQTSIRDTTSPANSPETISRKKSSHPLIDTGALIQHVTYAVRTK